MNKILQELEDFIEDLGYKPGTPAYERALRAAKVKRCQEMQGVPDCPVCPAYDYCELTKLHQIDVRYPLKRIEPEKKDDDAG